MVQIAPRIGIPHVAGCLLGLWATLANLPTATSQTSALELCPEETVFCAGDDDCRSCLETLQAGNIAFDFEFDECNELYVDVCGVVEDAGCDITNSFLMDFAGCIAEEEFGCSAFTSCEAAIAAENNVTVAPTPSLVMTAAPSAAPVAVATMVPSSAEDARDAEEQNGVSRTVTAAATRTALAFAVGLAVFLTV